MVINAGHVGTERQISSKGCTPLVLFELFITFPPHGDLNQAQLNHGLVYPVQL